MSLKPFPFLIISFAAEIAARAEKINIIYLKDSSKNVIAVKAAIYNVLKQLDSRLRGSYRI